MLRVRGLFAALICLVVAGAASAQATKDAKPAIDKDKIVGSWVLVKGDALPPNSSVEFTKDGKMKAKIDANGKTIMADGTFKLDGDKLTVTMKNPGGKDEVEVDTIKVLSADKLIFTDPKGKESEFKRVTAKKPATK